MTMRALVSCALSAVLLSACGHGTVVSLRSGSTPDPSQVTVAEACPVLEPQHLPPDVGPVDEAYVCTLGDRLVAGDGEWSTRVVRRVTGGLDDLLKAYAVPDAALSGGACTLELPDPLVVYLHSERTIAVRAPRDDCSKPTVEARRVREALTTVVVSEHQEHLVRSQLSVETGCPDGFKDVLSFEEHGGSSGQPSGPPRRLGAGARVCRYDVTTDEGGWRLGKLSTGNALSDQQLTRVNEELGMSETDASCSRSEHTRFAVVIDPQSDWTEVALDGCAVLQGSSSWRGTDRLRELLAA